jgi:hypothetical protein
VADLAAAGVPGLAGWTYVTELRLAFGDEMRDPRYVATVLRG